MKKRGQSQIISTILLILIAVAAIFIILNFVVPFVKDKLLETKCIDALDKIEITNNEMYTCYDDTNKNLRVQISLKDISDDLIKGFQLNIERLGQIEYSVDITPDNPDNIGLYNPAESFRVPGKNEEVTYLIDDVMNKPDSISLIPLLKNGKICKPYNLNYINSCL